MPVPTEALVDAVLSTGRLQGARAAAELWLAHVNPQLLTPDSMRARNRQLTRLAAATGDETDVRLAAYVVEVVTLAVNLAEATGNSSWLTTPDQVEALFRRATQAGTAQVSTGTPAERRAADRETDRQSTRLKLLRQMLNSPRLAPHLKPEDP
jgi:hypothetical protein